MVFKGLLQDNKLTRIKMNKKSNNNLHACTCTEMQSELSFGFWDYKNQVSL